MSSQRYVNFSTTSNVMDDLVVVNSIRAIAA